MRTLLSGQNVIWLVLFNGQHNDKHNGKHGSDVLLTAIVDLASEITYANLFQTIPNYYNLLRALSHFPDSSSQAVGGVFKLSQQKIKVMQRRHRAG
jgi:hypothetical protein